MPDNDGSMPYGLAVRQRMAEIGVAAVVGLAAAALAFGLFGLRPQNQASPEATTSTLPSRDVVAPSVFLDAWERSRVGPYVVVGTLERNQGESVQVMEVRHARQDGRSLEQTGNNAIVAQDGGLMDCERFDTGEILCAEPTVAPSPRQERGAMETLFVGPDEGDYQIFSGDRADCYWIVARQPTTSGTFGQSSEFCFDQQTGAVVSYTIATGGSTTTFEATEVTAEVTEDALRPG